MRRLGVVFGSRSVEHEVSVITALQAMAALPAELAPVPVYISKTGSWHTGDVLTHLEEYRDPERLLARTDEVLLSTDPRRPGLRRLRSPAGLGRFRRAAHELPLEPLDVILPLVHGSHGEDGTLQGLCDLAGLPYCGPGTLAAALTMDKALTKTVLRAAGLPVLDGITVTRRQWRTEPTDIVQRVVDRFGFPVFVKPMALGSSIGVARADDDDGLADAIELAAAYEARILIEPAQEGIVEVNCSVIGDGADCRPSVCEQPVSSGHLSYDDKYLAGGKGKGGGKEGGGSSKSGMQSARRVIPAPLDAALTSAIQHAAMAAFAAVGLSGVARIDFMVRPERGEFVINEINSIPGSLSFYLWEPAGLSFQQLLAELVDIADRRHADRDASTYSIDSWLLRPPTSS